MNSGNNNIKEMASVEVGDKSNRIYCLTVIGEIECHVLSSGSVKTTK